MKLQLLKFLTVGLLTLIVLSPELVVLSVVWEKHMQLLETKDFMCEVKSSIFCSQDYNILALQSERIFSTQYTDNINSLNSRFLNLHISPLQWYQIILFFKWFFILFPICLGILFFSYDRYLVYRATVFQRQVDILEKLWHKNIE